jgi:hypothetical protein
MTMKKINFYRGRKADDLYAYNLGWNNAMMTPTPALKDAIKDHRQYRGFLANDHARWSAAARSYELGRIDSLNALRYE